MSFYYFIPHVASHMPSPTLRPNFFLIGCPRSGSTSLYDWLGQHPDIYMSPMKEPHFFGNDLHRSPHPDMRHQNIHDEVAYHALFNRAAQQAIRGEASPCTYISRTAIDEIDTFSPNARYLMIVRHPFDIVYSFHCRWMTNGWLTEEDFLPLCQPDAILPKNAISYHKLEELGRYHLLISRIPEAINTYQQRHGERFKVVTFKQLKTYPEHTLHDIFHFLNIDDSFFPQCTPQNAYFSTRSQLVHRMIHHADRVILPLRKMVSKKPLGITEKIKRLNSTSPIRPNMPEKTHMILLEQYHKTLEELEKLLGKNAL